MIRGHLQPAWIERAEASCAHHRAMAETLRGSDKRGYEGDRTTIQRQGAWGEAFVAQVYGLPMQELTADQFDKRHLPDVGPVDVRATAYRSGGLILHEDDPSERIVVLTYVPRDPKPADLLGIVGWLLAELGKHERYWPGPNPRRPCYLVPAMDLRAPQQLKLELGGQAVLW